MPSSVAKVANVLVVDDRRDSLLVIEAVLEPLGQRLVMATSGDEALRHVLDEDFAVIILDVRMPGIDGMQTAALIKARERSRLTPIIFLTGDDASATSALRGYAHGAVDFIQKPFEAEILRAKVAVFVELYLQRELIRTQEDQLRRQEQERAARAEAEAQRRHIFSLFTQAPTPICVTRGPEHRIELANPHYARLVGDRVLEGRTIREALPELEGQGLFELMDRVFATGEAFPGNEVPIRMRWESDAVEAERFFNFIYQPLVVDGKVDGVMTFAFEVTEQVAARRRVEAGALERAALLHRAESARADAERLAREAQDAVRVRDDFISIASHELNTPLTPLKLQVAMLRMREPSAQLESLPKTLEIVDRQIDRLTKLVATLLDVSRITAGRLALEPESLDLAEVVRDVSERFAPEAARCGSELRVRAEPGARGAFDRMRIEQVLTNVVTNAIKYGSGKPIDVSLDAQGGHARIVVRDRGIGVPEDMRVRIFDRFERAVSSRHFGGFGLGLWIARQLVEASGGTIALETASDGAGSSFVVDLPISPTSP